MAFSPSSCFFNFPSFTLNQQPSSSSSSSSSTASVRYSKPRSPPITANFAKAERTTSNTTRSQRIASSSSLYEVLEIQIGADTVEVKAVYRRLARILHPDVENRDSSADEFMKVHSAYATLSDPRKRADYDRSLFVRQKMSVTSSSSVGYGGRRWETDRCW